MDFRWSNLPSSEQEQLYMKHTTTALISIKPNEIRKNLSGLIYHEKINDDGYLCYYKNLAGDDPITYLCNIGCCPNGCCAFQKVKQNGSYDLMIVLLLIFIFVILFAAVAMLIIYYIYNRKSDQRGYEFSGSFTEDSVVGSQINGPPSYFNERRYLPHINPVKVPILKRPLVAMATAPML
ncbi:Uncharacterized protein ACO02O_02602 [Dirofilaria immitis]